MPYRRLPNTDKARVRAMKKALYIGKQVSPVELAFSQATLQKVKYFLPLFEQTMVQQQQAYYNQVRRGRDYLELYRKAKLYISHFIQVLNMAVARGELPVTVKKNYGISENAKRVPTLNTENDVIRWGERIIKGEQERLAKGGNPITNPTIALVRVRYEQFVDSNRKQKSLQEINTRALGKVANLRTEADRIILNIWNEVENKFSDLPDREKRERASVYGLVYVYRRNEKGNLTQEEDDDSDSETMTLQEARALDRQEKEHELQTSFRFPDDDHEKDNCEKETEDSVNYSVFRSSN
ncbi:MAG: hypothetical protein KJ607_10140 [Bacteroidetes bacterium]|nr:hypothetical protein [Bacteroidota bacterium]